MAIFRQYIAPLLIVLVFLFALVAVGIRSFLPADMAAPAPIEDVNAAAQIIQPDSTTDVAEAPSLDALIHGLPDTATVETQL
jgi:hypothetical protein